MQSAAQHILQDLTDEKARHTYQPATKSVVSQLVVFSCLP